MDPVRVDKGVDTRGVNNEIVDAFPVNVSRLVHPLEPMTKIGLEKHVDPGNEPIVVKATKIGGGQEFPFGFQGMVLRVFFPQRPHVTHLKGALTKAIIVPVRGHETKEIVVDFGINKTLFVHAHHVLIPTGVVGLTFFVAEVVIKEFGVPSHHVSVSDGVIGQEPLFRIVVFEKGG